MTAYAGLVAHAFSTPLSEVLAMPVDEILTWHDEAVWVLSALRG